jgi:CDP-glucose 4,6-dehydratase
VAVSSDFWKGRRALVTGHTGFKGSWLSFRLQRLGAAVTGYSLPPPTRPSLFELAGLEQGMVSVEGDVRDLEHLRRVVQETRPEIIFHLAAQSLVRLSYEQPVETYATNVMGVAHLLECARESGGLKAVLVVTSDKCYENLESGRSYVEGDPLGGSDPYSSSKGCAEIVTAAYRRSFFGGSDAPVIATARAGNVIGGGDWAHDRLVPDILSAFLEGRPAQIRNPRAIRPWQHVLEPVGGYLRLAERMASGERDLEGAWNFGPEAEDCVTVGEVAEKLARMWSPDAAWSDAGLESPQPHEAGLLRLDCSKAQTRLGWSPTLDLTEALEWTAAWYRGWHEGTPATELLERDVANFERLRREPRHRRRDSVTAERT